MRAKRKPRRRSDSSGGYNLSDVIQSPPTAGQLTHTAYYTRLLTVFEQSITLTVAYTWEYRLSDPWVSSFEQPSHNTLATTHKTSLATDKYLILII